MAQISKAAPPPRDVLEEYGCPTFRQGVVFSRISNITKKNFEEICSGLLQKFNFIKHEVSHKPVDFGFNEVINDLSLPNLLEMTAGQDVSTDPFSEGPAVMLPEFSGLMIGNQFVSIRCSISPCVSPHHSKIWVRISYLGDKTTFEENRMFFENARFVSNKLINSLQKIYGETLNQQGISENLKREHSIIIKTISKNLEDVVPCIDDESPETIKQLEEYLMRVIPQEDIPGEWIKFTDPNTESGKMTGIYSKYHDNFSTIFSGIVHEPSTDKCNHYTKEMSKILLQHIASTI